MDFIVFYSLIGTILRLIVFSYDIACQWSCNLPRQIAQLPDTMHLMADQLTFARFVIPKFHIYAHGLSCQTSFSLNFLPFMARTNREDPERWWAHINPVSMSTKEMGPGARLDTLDDHAAAWNWRKIVGMGEATISSRDFCSLFSQGSHLATQLGIAVQMAQEQHNRHKEFTATFPADTIRKWSGMVTAWNQDSRATNPYMEPVISES